MAEWTVWDTLKEVKEQRDALKKEVEVSNPLMKLREIRKLRKEIMSAKNTAAYINALVNFKEMGI